ncbi:MAG: hypothetical protein ABR878_12915 [Roseiarcus sp.]
MIEQAIFSCIGFLVAALLAVAAAPAISRRALRLAEARARLLAPLTEAQAIAERDALRAQHAVDLLRLEQRLSAAEDVAARRQIEIGRHANRIVALEDVSAERAAEIAAQREELGALQREVRELCGELGAVQIELRDLTFQRDASDAEAAAAQASRLDLETLVDQNRTTIATLETRVAGLEIRLADSERAASAAAKTAEAERARLSAALAERDGELGERDAANRDHADQLSALATAQAIVDGALHAERAESGSEVDRLRAGPAEASPNGGAASDQALRKAIARLGRDMARLNGKARGAEAEPSNLVNFDRRDAHAHPAGSSEATHSAPAGKIRQGQPMAPER